MVTSGVCAACGWAQAPGAPACGRCGRPVWLRCPRCGGVVGADARFCGTCGLAFAPPQAFAAPPGAMPPQAFGSPAWAPPTAPAEQVLGAIPEARIKTGMFSSEMYVLVVTDRRLLGAKVTNDLLKQIIEEARAAEKAKGGGFFGQWAAQVGAATSLGRRYAARTPDAILGETPGNWALEPAQVREIKVQRANRGGGEDEIDRPYLRITIDGVTGKVRYDTDTENPSRSSAVEMLSVAFGGRVR